MCYSTIPGLHEEWAAGFIEVLLQVMSLFLLFSRFFSFSLTLSIFTVMYLFMGLCAYILLEFMELTNCIGYWFSKYLGSSRPLFLFLSHLLYSHYTHIGVPSLGSYFSKALFIFLHSSFSLFFGLNNLYWSIFSNSSADLNLLWRPSNFLKNIQQYCWTLKFIYF